MGSYGALWKARFQLIRPGNVAMAALGTLIGFLIGVEHKTDLDAQDWLADFGWLPACLAAACITAFGNVINDLRDVKIDAVAHPQRPLVTGAINANQAGIFGGILLAAGLWAAFQAGIFWSQDERMLIVLFAAGNAALLVFYEIWAKQRGVIGNIVVAALVASTFIFGDLSGGGVPLTPAVLLLAAMAFGTNLAREIIKDVEDGTADVGRQTVAKHPRAAKTGATLLILAAVATSGYAWSTIPWPAVWGVPLLAADIALLSAAVLLWRDVGLAQRISKLGMLLALVAFLLGAWL